MMKSGFLRVLFAIVGIGALGLPHTAFAQHGGHGGGGGHYGYSGHSYVGYHGGGYFGPLLCETASLV